MQRDELMSKDICSRLDVVWNRGGADISVLHHLSHGPRLVVSCKALLVDLEKVEFVEVDTLSRALVRCHVREQWPQMASIPWIPPETDVGSSTSRCNKRRRTWIAIAGHVGTGLVCYETLLRSLERDALGRELFILSSTGS